MESGNPVAANIKESKKRKEQAEENQLMLVQSDDSEIVRRLREVDLNTMNPIQAMILLSELKELI
jgi:DNA mismatch repair protein MutS